MRPIREVWYSTVGVDHQCDVAWRVIVGRPRLVRVRVRARPRVTRSSLVRRRNWEQRRQ